MGDARPGAGRNARAIHRPAGNINLTPDADRRISIFGRSMVRSHQRTSSSRRSTTAIRMIDPATFRLKISGLVDRPKSLSLDELQEMKSTELVAGSNAPAIVVRSRVFSGNGRWTGVPLKTVLDSAGVKPQAREFVFFGADHGEEEVEFRGQKSQVDQQFGRSLPREKAMSAEPLLAYALNGEPLTRHQGSPLRLLVPGWYGVANVKWLSQIHVQEDAYLGKYQARWYRTLEGRDDRRRDEVEGNRSHAHAVEVVHRASHRTAVGTRCFGVVLNDGTPLKSVEVRVDDGPWQPATMDPATTSKYSWKLFTYTWNGATPGEHTLVSRVTDVNGKVQPTAEDLENKKTFLEDNSQHPRKVMIA